MINVALTFFFVRNENKNHPKTFNDSKKELKEDRLVAKANKKKKSNRKGDGKRKTKSRTRQAPEIVVVCRYPQSTS